MACYNIYQRLNSTQPGWLCMLPSSARRLQDKQNWIQCCYYPVLSLSTETQHYIHNGIPLACACWQRIVGRRCAQECAQTLSAWQHVFHTWKRTGWNRPSSSSSSSTWKTARVEQYRMRKTERMKRAAIRESFGSCMRGAVKGLLYQSEYVWLVEMRRHSAWRLACRTMYHDRHARTRGPSWCA